MNEAVVILAGGLGTRVSHLSGDVPKQFLKLFNGLSSFQLTVNLAIQVVTAVYVVTHRSFRNIVLLQLSEIDQSGKIKVIFEEHRLNTSVAALWALEAIQKDFSNPVTTCIMAADCMLGGVLSYILRAMTVSRVNRTTVFLGLPPVEISSNFGYILLGNGGEDAHNVLQFIEKPGPTLAKQLLETQQCLWNSGITVCQSDQILTKLTAVKRESFCNLNIDSAVLSNICGAMAIEMTGTAWMDIGNPRNFFLAANQRTNQKIY